jgi:hypothetical protein
MVVEGIEKVANRITNGLLIASIIIGASLLMRIDTSWRLFGYPGFAMLFFLFGAFSALTLIYNIYAHDRKARKRRQQGP